MTDISMDENGVEQFLFAGRILRLATLKEDGSPHIVPIWYLYENRKIYLHTEEKSVKVANIRRDDRVAVCVDVGEFYYDLKNVIVEGKARILKEAGLARSVAEKIQVKYFGSASHPQAQRYLSPKSRHVVIEISLARKRHSEDYSVLAR